MKAIRIFGRSIRDAFKSITRNFSLSMASILCDMITLIIVSVAIIIAVNVNNATRSIEKEMNIVVYINKNASEEDSNNAYLEIKKVPNIQTVKFGETMVEEVVSAFDIIQKVTIGIVIALIVVTAFLISNTIKLTIYSRKNEIEIMRLVGASNTAIKLPFLFEGLFLGIIGSIIPVCITIYGYVILFNTMHGYMFTETLNLIKPYNFVFYVSGVIVLIGAIVGMFGSANSVRKYLKI